jgi:hypothetical protein
VSRNPNHRLPERGNLGTKAQKERLDLKRWAEEERAARRSGDAPWWRMLDDGGAAGVEEARVRRWRARRMQAGDAKNNTVTTSSTLPRSLLLPLFPGSGWAGSGRSSAGRLHKPGLYQESSSSSFSLLLKQLHSVPLEEICNKNPLFKK